jgi:hypothetical protein
MALAMLLLESLEEKMKNDKLYSPGTLNEKWVYEGVSKIFRTDAEKIIKLTIRPIGRHHPRSSSLPHVDTGPTVSSVF